MLAAELPGDDAEQAFSKTAFNQCFAKPYKSRPLRGRLMAGKAAETTK